jgi:hypothetical protein
MIVMPANSSGWFWHSLARETGRLGHLYSPGAQRGPWPWFPYALDNGAFSCWDQNTNTFDASAWDKVEAAWRRLLFWAQAAPIQARWAIVPDVPGDAMATLERWSKFAPIVARAHIPIAVAVQDGMDAKTVNTLSPPSEVVCVGGTTEWKWATAQQWCLDFPRVHVLRCNSPTRLVEIDKWGCESSDGTGWNRGNRKQTEGLETWARKHAKPVKSPLWPYVCRNDRTPWQLSLA